MSLKLIKNCWSFWFKPSNFPVFKFQENHLSNFVQSSLLSSLHKLNSVEWYIHRKYNVKFLFKQYKIKHISGVKSGPCGPHLEARHSSADCGCRGSGHACQERQESKCSQYNIPNKKRNPTNLISGIYATYSILSQLLAEVLSEIRNYSILCLRSGNQAPAYVT